MKRPYLFDVVPTLILILLVALLTSCGSPEPKSVPMPMPEALYLIEPSSMLKSGLPPPEPKHEPMTKVSYLLEPPSMLKSGLPPPEPKHESMPGVLYLLEPSSMLKPPPAPKHEPMPEVVYKPLLKPKTEYIYAGEIARKRRLRTEQTSETLTTPKSIGIAISEYINSLDVGKVEYRVEEKMVEGKSTKVEAWIAKRFTEDIATTLRQRGFSSANIKVGTSMGMSLKGSAFKIDAPNEIEKSIGDQDIGKWLWEVVPLQSGQQKLSLTACVLIKMENIENIPPKCEEVFSKEFNVEVNRAYKAKIFVIHNWKEIIGFIISSGVIGYLFNKKKRKTRKKKT